MPKQYKDAEDAYNRAIIVAKTRLSKGYTFILTGHSLGGGLAAVLSAKKGGLPVVTFNAPGMLSSLISDNVGPFGAVDTTRIDTANMFHYRSSLDPVSKASGPHIGNVHTVFVSTQVNFSIKEAVVPFLNIAILSGKIGYAQHSIETMIKALESGEKYRKPIVFKTKKTYGVPGMPAPAMA